MSNPKDQKKTGPAAKLGGVAQRKELLKELGESENGREIKGYEEYLAKMTALDKLMEDYS